MHVLSDMEEKEEKKMHDENMIVSISESRMVTILDSVIFCLVKKNKIQTHLALEMKCFDDLPN